MADIRHAWCLELNDTFTAHQAKREFFAMEPRPEKLSFFCADEKCRSARPGGTRVTCVNYTRLPSEEAQSMAVHYRELDKHQPDCTASGPKDAPRQVVGDGHAPGERTAKTKRSDSFQVFDPGADAEPAWRPGTPRPVGGEGNPAGHGGGNGGKSKADPSSEESVSSTRFVEDLAPLHFDAPRDPEAKELLQQAIYVRGVGRGRLGDLFMPVSRALVGSTNQIWFGGAKFKKYGKGFRLEFYDKVEGLTVVTYVSPDQVRGYRYRSMLEETISAAEGCRYVRAYVWGTVTPSDREGQASLNPARLQHLAIILGPPKETPLDD